MATATQTAPAAAATQAAPLDRRIPDGAATLDPADYPPQVRPMATAWGRWEAENGYHSSYCCCDACEHESARLRDEWAEEDAAEQARAEEEEADRLARLAGPGDPIW